MKILKYFFGCYFYQSKGFGDLDNVIQDFKITEDSEYQLQFIQELHQIIKTNNYDSTSRFIHKYGNRTFDIKKTEKFINFLYDKLIDRQTDVKAIDFQKKFKGVFCPICCPDPQAAIQFSLIEKAMVIEKDLQIYICRPCKLVWLTEDIQSNNAQDYKKFMNLLGLKGLWKELKNIDAL